MPTYKITNEALFAATVTDVDFNNFFGDTGNIQIELADGNIREIDGQHGAKDYEGEYGFVLIF